MSEFNYVSLFLGIDGFDPKHLAHEAVKAAGISDSQRYKMAGNAVTVNVIYHYRREDSILNEVGWR